MSPIEEPRPEMSLEEFRLIRELVYEYCGIRFRDDMKFSMERRLWPRLEELSLPDFSAYYRYLRHDPLRKVELDSAVEALATNETYFFREQMQLKAFSTEVLPLLHKRNERTRRLHLWSAGCSTGEEVYTLAMLIHASGLFGGWEVWVYGTDISRRVLAHARRGEYSPSALRIAPQDMVDRYLEKSAPNRWRVCPEIKAMVDFGYLNLLDADAASTAVMHPVDVIFCRNVMIYFDIAARKRVLKVFYERLVEGGYLLMGHSDLLINLSTEFELVHLQNDLIYRRPPRAQEPRP